MHHFMPLEACLPRKPVPHYAHKKVRPVVVNIMVVGFVFMRIVTQLHLGTRQGIRQLLLQSLSRKRGRGVRVNHA